MKEILSNPKTRHYADRHEWETARTQGIGASEVGTLIGVNPYEGVLELWQRKTGRIPAKPQTQAMHLGHLLESAVAELFAEATGAYILPESVEDFTIYDESKPFFRVSPDRLYTDPASREICLLECKTTLKQVDEDNIPPYWYAQLQYQLAVTQKEVGTLAWLVAGRDFGYKTYRRDDDYCKLLLEEVERFWTSNILDDIEPEPRSAVDTALAYPAHVDGKTAEATEEIYNDWQTLCGIRQRLKDLTAAKEALEDKLKFAIGDAERIEYCGQTLATYKASKPSLKFDAKSFSAEHPEIYGQYCKEKPGSRTLLIK